MPIISNTVQNNSGNSSATISSRSRTYRSGNSTLHLQEGQTLKGVVSDVHGNEITLSMDDGSSFTGQLPDANQYSIGQKAAFQITNLDNNTIYMKALSNAYLLDMDDTIEQALEEAGLPKSTRNLEVVRSLLQNQQSISRNNILASIRLCAGYPEADVDTIITMKRLDMPMTSENVRQFENYRQQTHQLLYKMDSLSDSIGDMLNAIGEQVPRLAKQVGVNLLNIALEGNPTMEEMELAQNQETIQSSALVEDMPLTDEEGNPIAKEQTEADSAVIAEEMTEETEAQTESAGGPLARMKQLLSNITDGNAAAKNAVAESGLTDDFRTPFIHEQTGFILSPEERQAFAKALADYPLSDAVKEGIADGTLTARQFLTEVQKAFSEMSEAQASSLLTSKSFHALIKGQFLSGWTLSPERLKQEGALDEVYDKMSRQFEALSKFSEHVLGKDVFTGVSGNASDMSENLDFMRTLNQTFQYIQLPLKLQNQNAHGDLYVMTRKEALKKDPNHLKVLLHLDMDYLGTLDIQISKENTAVTTKFFVSSKETKNLLEQNIELLSAAINKQGYAFTSELTMKEKEVDIVNDFIAAEAPVGDFKRYNFDLRA